MQYQSAEAIFVINKHRWENPPPLIHNNASVALHSVDMGERGESTIADSTELC